MNTSLLPINNTNDFKTRAVDLVIHAQVDPRTANGTIRRVTKVLGPSSETRRTWVRNYKNSGAATPVQSIDLESETKRLPAELAEPKQANEIPKGATLFAV